MPATRLNDRAYRLKRIESKAVPELLQAWKSGSISLKAAYRICRLSARKQRVQLAQYLEARAANNERQAAWRTKPKRARSMFASAGYLETKERRLRRIKRLAIPQLVSAFEDGRLSLRATELLSRLSHRQQRTQLVAQLGRQQEKIQGEELAATAIGRCLQDQGGQIQLSTVLDRIIETIRGKDLSEVADRLSVSRRR